MRTTLIFIYHLSADGNTVKQTHLAQIKIKHKVFVISSPLNIECIMQTMYLVVWIFLFFFQSVWNKKSNLTEKYSTKDQFEPQHIWNVHVFFFTVKKCVEVVSLIISDLQKWLQITTHSKLTKSSLNQTALFFI